MSDSDSFEDIGFSDCESDETVRGEEEDSKTVVLVELPPEMILRAATNSTEVANTSEQESVASSFIPIRRMGGIKIESKEGELKKGGDDDEDGSSWSHVSKRNTTERDCDASSTGQDVASLSTWATRETTATISSVLTGFDLLSLNGSTHRKCKRCSFLNSETCVICTTCYGALVPNPCLDIDTQIALNLQRKEEEEAFDLLRGQEKKRKQYYQQRLFDEAATLATKITQGVDATRCHGVTVLPKSDLIFHISNFVECFRQRDADRCEFVELAYHLSGMMGSGTLLDIQKHGLRDGVCVSPNIEAAYNYTNDPSSVSSTLFSISEDQNTDADDSKKLCWIVATADVFAEAWSEETVCVLDGTASVKSFRYATHCLPLVCFDASLRCDEHITWRLMNGMSEICFEFFSNLGDPLFEDSLLEGSVADIDEVYTQPPSKRPKGQVGDSSYPIRSLGGDIFNDEEQEQFQSFCAGLCNDPPNNGDIPSKVTNPAPTGRKMTVGDKQKEDNQSFEEFFAGLDFEKCDAANNSETPSKTTSSGLTRSKMNFGMLKRSGPHHTEHTSLQDLSVRVNDVLSSSTQQGHPDNAAHQSTMAQLLISSPQETMMQPIPRKSHRRSQSLPTLDAKAHQVPTGN